MPLSIQESNWLVQVLFMLITGKHFGPFWFLPMITLIYLIAPLLLFLDRTSWFYRFLFPLIFLAGCFLYRFGHNSSIFESFLYFLPIYMFGMWASHYRELFLNKGYQLLIPLIVLYGVITCLEILDILAIGKTYAYGEQLKDNAYLINFGKLKTSALCIIFMIILYRLRHLKASILGVLATYSFGVYFVHLYVIRLLEIIVNKINFNVTFNSLIYLGHISFITLICILIVGLVKTIAKKRSRYLVGC